MLSCTTGLGLAAPINFLLGLVSFLRVSVFLNGSDYCLGNSYTVCMHVLHHYLTLQVELRLVADS